MKGDAFLYQFSWLGQVAAIDNAVKIMLKYFPDVPVFPAVGNHEGSPVNRYHV